MDGTVVIGCRGRSAPGQAERDERVTLDLPLTFEEGARVLVAVRPDGLPDTESDIEPEVDR